MADIDPDQAQQLQQLQIALTSGAMPGLGGVLPAFGAPPAAPEAPSPSGDSYAPTPMTGYDAAITKHESGGNPYAHSQIPGQTASGLFGFTDGTYQQTIKNHPDLVDTSGRPLDRNDPRVLHALTIDNAKEISPQIGRQPTQVDLMAAHLLGAAGAVHFLRSDPNSSVVGAVSPEALANNKQVFFNPDGSPKTVAQVYADAAQKVKADPAMPPVEGGYASPYDSKNAPALTASGTAAPNDPMAKAQAMFAPQQAKIDAYEAGQPAMWAKLKAMQDEYKQATRPTFMNDIQDALAGMQQQQAIAQGNMHANAGAILSHVEQPSGKDFAAALASGHAIDMAQRQHRYDQAKSDYELGSTTEMAKNAQALSNLGLSSDLIKSVITAGQKGQELGISQQQADTQATHVANEFSFQMAQLGQTQQVEIGNYAKGLITNDFTRAKVMLQFSQQRTPGASYAQNVSLLNGLTAQAIKDGLAVSDKAPQLQDVVVPDGKGGQTHEVVNLDPSQDGGLGVTRMKELAAKKDSGFTSAPIGSTQAINVTNTQTTGGSGSGGEGGAARELPPAAEYKAAQQMKANVEGAKQIMAYLEKNGGTSALSADPNGMALRGVLQQYNITADPTLSARQVLAKMMASIANQATQSDLRTGGGNTSGRGGYAMFAQINKGNVNDTASPAAINQFLEHTGRIADYNMGKNNALVEGQHDALINHKPYWDTEYEGHRYATQANPDGTPMHPYPQWHPDDLTVPTTSANPAAGPAGRSSPTGLVEGQTGMDKASGKPIVVRNGKWDWQ